MQRLFQRMVGLQRNGNRSTSRRPKRPKLLATTSAERYKSNMLHRNHKLFVVRPHLLRRPHQKHGQRKLRFSPMAIHHRLPNHPDLLAYRPQLRKHGLVKPNQPLAPYRLLLQLDLQLEGIGYLREAIPMVSRLQQQWLRLMRRAAFHNPRASSTLFHHHSHRGLQARQR